ncbi:ABC transporter substrate-binding protein [Ralstonia pseudosolanacearum]|uniref:ABC transporter substrate-binding protein n=1 Tax=Ralstonia pseudosolanacearum TaxID=1310165 RepID=UPI00399D735C
MRGLHEHRDITVSTRRVDRWRLPVAILILAVLFGLANVPLPAMTSRPHLVIMVSGTAKIIYLPAILTQRLGYFRDEGLDVELVSRPAGVDAENELLTGFAQGVVGFYDHTVDLQTKGREARSIVVLSNAPGQLELVSTRKPLNAEAIEDLRGYALGVTGLGSSSSFLTRYLMSQHGQKPGDYMLVPAGAEEGFIRAVSDGRVNAGMTTDPTASVLVATGQARPILDLRTIDGTRKALGGIYPAACLYVQTEWSQANPDLAHKLARAFVRTLRFLHSHTAEEIAERLPPEYLGPNPRLYLQALEIAQPAFSVDGRMPPDGPATVQRVLAASNAKVRGGHVELARTYTDDFVVGIR